MPKALVGPALVSAFKAMFVLASPIFMPPTAKLNSVQLLLLATRKGQLTLVCESE